MRAVKVKKRLTERTIFVEAGKRGTELFVSQIEFECRGYRQALYTGMIIFLAPPVPFAVVVHLIWNWLVTN